MEAYIHAARQVKDDIAAELLKDVPAPSPEESVKLCPHGPLVMENVEIVFRNSAKNRLFSDRRRGVKTKQFEDYELLPAYITTSDDDTYQDALDSVSCCKKISYFLFISRYEKFQITQRNKYSDLLRRLEGKCPDRAIQTYHAKKDLIGLMREDEDIKPTYDQVLYLVAHYIQAIQELLDAQSEVYECEQTLVGIFNEYLGVLINADPSSPHAKKLQTDAAFVKALKQAFDALDNRGLELPKLDARITRDYVKNLNTILSSHLTNLQGEAGMIKSVCGFLEILIQYSDMKYKPPKEKTGGADSGVKSMMEDFSSAFKSWLGG